MRKKQSELSLDNTTYKTTITFKGMAKSLVGRLGHSKSVVINALVTDALKSGKMADFLIEYFPASSVHELLETINPKQATEPRKKIPVYTTAQPSNASVFQEFKQGECHATIEKTAHKENKDGFDF